MESSNEQTQKRREFSLTVYKLIPQRFRGVSFDGIDPIVQPAVKEVIDSLATDNRKGILLTGEVGTGKTSILYVILRAYWWIIINEKWDFWHIQGLMGEGVFTTLPSFYSFVRYKPLIAILREHYGPNGDRDELPRVFTAPVVFIDELSDSNDDNRWNCELIEEFCNYRWENCLPLYMTTNMSGQEILEWPGFSRVVDRLLDRNFTVRVNIDGESRRDSGIEK